MMKNIKLIKYYLNTIYLNCNKNSLLSNYIELINT